MTDRISRERLYLKIAQEVSERSTCERKHVGAVIVPRRGILLIGYNGAPAGLPHCLDVGCLIAPDGGCLRTQHAEANAIAWAARNGIALEGAEIYATISPCLFCAKMIINAGIKAVHFTDRYRDTEPLNYLDDAGIECLLHAP
jgi:dCMP deaminase